MSYLTNPYRYAGVSWDNFSELKAYWKFDESSGNIINQAEAVGSTDSIGSGADIILNDATHDEDGIIDKSVSFNGTSSYGELGTSLSQWSFFHNVDATFTISMWFYFSGTISGRVINNVPSSEVNGISINIFGTSPNELQLQIFADGSNIFSKSWVYTPVTGAWYHYVWTIDQSVETNGGEFWANGVSQGTRNRTSDGGNTDDDEYSLYTASARINGGGPYAFLNTRIDEFSIWNRVLTDEEIALLYNNGDAFAL